MSLDLDSVALRGLSEPERLSFLKEQITRENEDLHRRHLAGEAGLAHSEARSMVADELIIALFNTYLPDPENPPALALVANGGYGRGLMNPGSDIDLLFLVDRPTTKISDDAKKIVRGIQMIIWDLGFKFLPSTRSVPECITEAKMEPQSRTALLDSRLVVGDQKLFRKLRDRFRKDCIEKDKTRFFEERSLDINTRHAKWSHTVFLQEPNIKESPGTLRDYQNLDWIIDAEAGTRSMTELVRKKDEEMLA